MSAGPATSTRPAESPSGANRRAWAGLWVMAAALAMICVSIAVVNRGQRQEEAKISGSASSEKA